MQHSSFGIAILWKEELQIHKNGEKPLLIKSACVNERMAVS